MKKKLLLVGVAAMGLLAVGVGATSTFAWYSAQAAAKIEGVSTDTAGNIIVSQHEATVGGITVPLKVSVESEIDNPAKLLYATYDGTVSAPKLKTGYISSGGDFVPVPAASVDSVFGYFSTSPNVSYVLSSSLKVTISIDFTAKIGGTGADKDNLRWVDTSASPDGTYDIYKFGGVQYDASQIFTSLQGTYVDIGFKASGRGCLFATEAADGDPNYSGTTVDADTFYYEAANQGVQLSAIDQTHNVVKTSAINYYITGKAGGTSGSRTDGSVETSATVNIGDVFSVNVKEHTA